MTYPGKRAKIDLIEQPLLEQEGFFDGSAELSKAFFFLEFLFTLFLKKKKDFLNGNYKVVNVICTFTIRQVLKLKLQNHGRRKWASLKEVFENQKQN